MRDFTLWVLAEGDAAPRSLSVRAGSQAAAMAQAAEQGYRVLSSGTAAAGQPPATRWRLRSPQPQAHNELLAEQLHTLLNSGIGPVEALRTLQFNATGSYRELLHRLCTELDAGRSLADALAATGQAAPLLVALVRAAEHTSDLPQALERFLTHHKRSNAVRQRLITTGLYPLLLMGLGTAVMAFLLFYVVPRFGGIFESLQQDLPPAARLLLAWSGLLRAHGWALLIAAAALLAGTGFALAQPPVRQRIAAWCLQRGWLGQQARLLYLSRYYRTAGALLEGGIALPQAMTMAQVLLPAHWHVQAQGALRRVQEGLRVSEALEAERLSTPVAHQLVQVGERSGQLGAMLTRVADFHEGEVTQNIERLMRVLEPVVMAIVGVGIGIVVIVMYLPIFELASAVQ